MGNGWWSKKVPTRRSSKSSKQPRRSDTIPAVPNKNSDNLESNDPRKNLVANPNNNSADVDDILVTGVESTQVNKQSDQNSDAVSLLRNP